MRLGRFLLSLIDSLRKDTPFFLSGKVDTQLTLYHAHASLDKAVNTIYTTTSYPAGALEEKTGKKSWVQALITSTVDNSLSFSMVDIKLSEFTL
jgi:hypothetical protein